MDLENKSLLKDVKMNFLFNMNLGGCPMPEPKKLKVNYTNDNLNLNLASNFGNALDLDLVAVVPKVPFNLGVKAALDLGTMGLKSHDVACALHNKINSDLSLATSMTVNKSATQLAVA